MHDTCECLPAGLGPGQQQLLYPIISTEKQSTDAAAPMLGTTTVSLIAQENVIMEKAWWAFKVLLKCSAVTLVGPARMKHHPNEQHSLASRA